MSESLSLFQRTNALMRIESMLEQIYDVLQEIRDDEDLMQVTSEIQTQIEMAQIAAEHGDYAEFDSASGLISHLHNLTSTDHAQT